MATIISRYRTTVAMMNSTHALLSENHPCTLFMVSLHPGYHDPPNSIHYHILRSDDEVSSSMDIRAPRCLNKIKGDFQSWRTRSMTKITVLGIVGGAALLVALPVSLQW